jgi:3-deoxy-D-manno-octulosonic-acid transferase
VSIVLNVAYLIAAIVASPWIAFRLIARGDRLSLTARFGAGLGEPLHRSIWLHGSSAGEIALLVPFVQLLEQGGVRNPLVISGHSATGYAAACRAFPGRRVIYFPFDLSFVVARFFKRFDPCLIVIVESEFWPNFLLTSNRRAIPVAVVNGKISEKSRRFYSATRFMPMLLRRLNLVAVQTKENAQRLERLGLPVDRVHVTGNMKYDLAQGTSLAEAPSVLRERIGYADDTVVILGGSVHEREDEAMVRAFKALAAEQPRARLVLAPRYPQDAGRVAQCAAAHGFATIRKTAIDSGSSGPIGPADILIVDTLGELRALYGLADIAFVGGSLIYRGSNRGGHNLMEPAVMGIPVLFGPYHSSFQDTARELIEADAGYEVRDAGSLTDVLLELLGDAQLRQAAGRRAREVILKRQGATEQNFELLLPLINAVNRRLPASSLSATMPPAISDVDLR